jgi:hypothetical protein
MMLLPQRKAHAQSSHAQFPLQPSEAELQESLLLLSLQLRKQNLSQNVVAELQLRPKKKRPPKLPRNVVALLLRLRRQQLRSLLQSPRRESEVVLQLSRTPWLKSRCPRDVAVLLSLPQRKNQHRLPNDVEGQLPQRLSKRP